MRRILSTLVSRKVLVLSFLTVGLAVAWSYKGTCVDGQSCDDLMVDWTLADWEYSAAFQSYYYDSPTTCHQDCQYHLASNPPNYSAYNQCVSACPGTRQTRLAAADLDLFDKAWDTCTPATPEQCDQARLMAENCAVQYNYLDYPDQEESLAIYQQYSACILASKVNSCQ
jgi:hypothetical protein